LRPHDQTAPGHNARTALAWQRTALSLLAGSAIVARLTLDSLGLVAVAAFLVVLPLAGWVLWESRARYLRTAGVRGSARSRGGRAPLMLTLATATIALTELAALLVPR
jgi:uncharacterized membrane protein YidH (DUF202 family)